MTKDTKMSEYDINNYDLQQGTSTVHSTQNYEAQSLRYYSHTQELTQGSAEAAGLDLHVESITPSAKMIGTGLFTSIPRGWVGLVVPRSSLGLKGFYLRNTIGVIDSDYRGEIMLAYAGSYTPQVGERVAQLVLVPHWVGAVERMASLDDLDATSRGNGGFGSTGV